MTFNELGLISPLLNALQDLSYKTPTPIQEQAVPVVLSGKDLLGSAQTGTGKTAGFALPILQKLAPFANTGTSPARHPVRALVLLPTRELALQVYESFVSYNKYLNLKIVCLHGGVDMTPQTQALQAGTEIIIATPGRFLDHFEQKNIFLSQLSFFVLDEADRMLDMGFLPDITKIMQLLPKNRQTLLFSATFSSEIKKLADTLLKSPVLVEVAKANTVADTITHHVVLTGNSRKDKLLLSWLEENNPEQALIFVDTKVGCNHLSRFLQRSGIAAIAIHGDKDQQDRLSALDAFRKGDVKLLVATDVAARGLDVENMPLVINFALPYVPEDYIHRIGRTGRRGQSGKAVSFVSNEEEKRLEEIEKLLEKKIHRSPLPLSTQPLWPRKTYLVTQKEESKLDFDVSQPFVCKNTDFPKERTHITSILSISNQEIVPILLGGTGRRNSDTNK